MRKTMWSGRALACAALAGVATFAGCKTLNERYIALEVWKYERCFGHLPPGFTPPGAAPAGPPAASAASSNRASRPQRATSAPAAWSRAGCPPAWPFRPARVVHPARRQAPRSPRPQASRAVVRS